MSDTQNQERKKNVQEIQEKKDARLQEFGQATLSGGRGNAKIHLMTIIGEIEGHECLASSMKSTKYEHVLPQLAMIEDSAEIDGVLILINTVGGAVESGLAIAEMIASLGKPTVSLVIGDSHSIGIPLATASDFSLIVPTGTMIIHPVRMTGLVIGAPQTYEYFQQMQDRIIGFISEHCQAKSDALEKMMLNTGMLSKDLGTILVGKAAVEAGIVDAVGGIKEALDKLYELIHKGK